MSKDETKMPVNVIKLYYCYHFNSYTKSKITYYNLL